MSKKRDYEKLPRKIKIATLCQVLNSDGNVCGYPAEMEVDAHLENEIYEDGACWIAFYVCRAHFESQYVWRKSYDERKR